MIEIRNKDLHLEKIVGVDLCVSYVRHSCLTQGHKNVLYFHYFYCLDYFSLLAHFEIVKNKFFKCASFSNIVLAILNPLEIPQEF